MMKSTRLIISVTYSTLIHLLIGCSLQHQAPEGLNTITGAFGFHFGEQIQSYQIKSEDDEVMVVEPTVIPRPNPLIERYVLLLDRENKRILEINGLNHSLSQRQCLEAKQKLVDSLKETYEFEITESLENLESRPKRSLYFGESVDKSRAVVGCLMNAGFLYSNSDTLLMIRYLSPAASGASEVLSRELEKTRI